MFLETEMFLLQLSVHNLQINAMFGTRVLWNKTALQGAVYISKQ